MGFGQRPSDTRSQPLGRISGAEVRPDLDSRLFARREFRPHGRRQQRADVGTGDRPAGDQLQPARRRGRGQFLAEWFAAGDGQLGQFGQNLGRNDGPSNRQARRRPPKLRERRGFLARRHPGAHRQRRPSGHPLECRQFRGGRQPDRSCRSRALGSFFDRRTTGGNGFERQDGADLGRGIAGDD